MREQAGEWLEPMARAALMMEGQIEGIWAHWTQGLTTAYMEGTQQPILSSEAQGARVSKGGEHASMLYFVAGKLTLPCY